MSIAVGDRVRVRPRSADIELIGDHPPTGVVRGIGRGDDGREHATIELDDGTLVMGVSLGDWEAIDE